MKAKTDPNVIIAGTIKPARTAAKKLADERDAALAELAKAKRQLADMELRDEDSYQELKTCIEEKGIYWRSLKDSIDREAELRTIVQARGRQIAFCQRRIARHKVRIARLRIRIRSTFGAYLKRFFYRYFGQESIWAGRRGR